MGAFQTQQINLKSGELLILRQAYRSDAKSIIDYFNSIGGETNFLSFGAGEFRYTIEQEEEILESYLRSDNQVYILAMIKDEVAGAINLGASQKKRLKHIGEFGLSVRKKHWNKGIGTYLLQAMLDWTTTNSFIRKINLIVQVENLKAIALYEKFGFEVEGRIRRDSCIDGKFFDTFRMGKLIDNESL